MLLDLVPGLIILNRKLRWTENVHWTGTRFSGYRVQCYAQISRGNWSDRKVKFGYYLIWIFLVSYNSLECAERSLLASVQIYFNTPCANAMQHGKHQQRHNMMLCGRAESRASLSQGIWDPDKQRAVLDREPSFSTLYVYSNEL